MKRILSTLILCYISINVLGQWQWAKQIGGPNFDGGGTYIDGNNNMYCSGVFTGVAYFESDTIYSSGHNDIFLAKYDSSGSEVWVKRIGGNNPSNYDESSGRLIIDRNHNWIYLTGKFYGTLNIDTVTINSNGILDIFIGKFDLNGNCIWLRKAGSNLDDGTSIIALDSNYDIYLSGVLGNSGTLGINSLSAGTFLSKFDSLGNIYWARNEMIGGYPGSIKIVNDVMYFCGVTSKDTAIVDTLTLISANYTDCIFGKLDTNGNVFWAKRFGGMNTDYAINFEMDMDNNIFMIGQFVDSILIDGDTISNNGKPDLLFVKFDSLGTMIWVRQSHSDGSLGAKAYSIIIDSEGTYYVGGYFSGNASFESYNVSSAISTSKDMFIARYNNAGDCLGVRHFGEAETYNIQIDSNGSLIVSGDFVNTISVGATTLVSHGNIDMFFAKTDAFTGTGEIGERRTNQLLIYANPTRGTCNITIPDEFKHEKKLTLSIYDNTGKLIQQGNVEMNEEKVRVNLEAEAKGIYNVTLSNGKKSYGGKIVFE